MLTGHEEITIEEAAQRVASRLRPEFPPEIQTDHQDVVILITKCWEEDYHARPEAEQVSQMLKDIRERKHKS